MKKIDKLKEWVSAERAEKTDERVPDARVWGEIRQRLVEEELLQEEKDLVREEFKPAPSFRIWWAAAAVLLLAVGLYSLRSFQLDHPSVRIAEMSVQIQQPDEPVEEVVIPLPAIKMEDTATRPVEDVLVQPSRPATVGEAESLEIKAARNLMGEQHSASKRMEGVLQLAELSELSPVVIGDLLEMVRYDPSSNVRLAALELLMERVPEAQAGEFIQEVFVFQDDPSLQVEMMLMMAHTDSIDLESRVAERLHAIADDPLAMDFVKEHAYAVLMNNW